LQASEKIVKTFVMDLVLSLNINLMMVLYGNMKAAHMALQRIIIGIKRAIFLLLSHKTVAQIRVI